MVGRVMTAASGRSGPGLAGRFRRAVAGTATSTVGSRLNGVDFDLEAAVALHAASRAGAGEGRRYCLPGRGLRAGMGPGRSRVTEASPRLGVASGRGRRIGAARWCAFRSEAAASRRTAGERGLAESWGSPPQRVWCLVRRWIARVSAYLRGSRPRLKVRARISTASFAALHACLAGFGRGPRFGCAAGCRAVSRQPSGRVLARVGGPSARSPAELSDRGRVRHHARAGHQGASGIASASVAGRDAR